MSEQCFGDQARGQAGRGNGQVSAREAAPAAFSTDDMVEAYEHFLPLAEALPADEVAIRRGDVTLARANIERGVEAIRPHTERIARALPEVSVTELLELPALALALIHADGRVGSSTSTGEIDAAFGKVSKLRDLTLRYLEVAAELDIVPRDRVRAIRAGKGKLDNARDCVDIAGVFHEFAEPLAGQHPFADDQLKELATVGTWLVQSITPRGTPRPSPVRDPAAAIRDRLWKLVDDRHDTLRTAGVLVFGIKHVDEHVPPLQSRSLGARDTADTPAAGATGDGDTPEDPGTTGASAATPVASAPGL